MFSALSSLLNCMLVDFDPKLTSIDIFLLYLISLAGKTGPLVVAKKSAVEIGLWFRTGVTG